MQFPRRNNGDMSSPNTATIPPTAESAEAVAKAQALAAENQLEFRERHALTIDAQAHTLLDPKYAREMRAIPLGVEHGRPVVAVADPSERRLSAIRKLVGGETKFVLVAPESLDALLKSRIFSENHEGREHAQHSENGNGAHGLVTVAPAEQASAPEQESTVAHDAPAAAAESQPEPPAPQLPDIDAANVTQLAEQLAAAAQTLLALQTQVQGIAAQFEHTRQELREQKEQLALAASKADQDRARIRSVAASLADDVARLEQTKADLAERLTGLVQDE